MAKIFHCLSDVGRLKIVVACLDEEVSVSHLVKIVGMSQSRVSHNLKILKEHRILKNRKDGARRLYSIDDGHIHIMFTNLMVHMLESIPEGPTQDQDAG